MTSDAEVEKLEIEAWERGANGAVRYISGEYRKEADKMLADNNGLDDHSDAYASNARRAVACKEIANCVDKLGEEYIRNEGRTEV